MSRQAWTATLLVLAGIAVLAFGLYRRSANDDWSGYCAAYLDERDDLNAAFSKAQAALAVDPSSGDELDAQVAEAGEAFAAMQDAAGRLAEVAPGSIADDWSAFAADDQASSELARAITDSEGHCG